MNKILILLFGTVCFSLSLFGMEEHGKKVYENTKYFSQPKQKITYNITCLQQKGEFLVFNDSEKCAWSCTQFLLNKKEFIAHLFDKFFVPASKSYKGIDWSALDENGCMLHYEPAEGAIHNRKIFYECLIKYLKTNKDTQDVYNFLKKCGYNPEEFFAELDEQGQ